MFPFTNKRKEPEVIDVSYLNQISKYKSVEPTNQIDLKKSREIEFVFLPDKKILLIGSCQRLRILGI